MSERIRKVAVFGGITEQMSDRVQKPIQISASTKIWKFVIHLNQLKLCHKLRERLRDNERWCVLSNQACINGIFGFISCCFWLYGV